FGITALHGASQHGLVGVVRLLLEKGADTEAKTRVIIPPNVMVTDLFFRQSS
ncbi:hypothetical protein B484DRAFT_391985, partial [Ochromonadaceae sp. CCMP2298]